MKMDKLTELLQQGVDKQIFPCGYLLIRKNEKLIFDQGIGVIPELGFQPNCHSRFDMASLTKVVATLPAILLLLEDRKIVLEKSIREYLDEVDTSKIGDITIHELLTHSSGLISSVKFYENEQKNVIKALMTAEGIFTEKKNVIYSDLNFLLLGKIIETVTGMSLDNFCKKYIYDPLKMNDTNFSPKNGIPTRIKNCVDDENARFFSESVGHAGLFSSAYDLDIYLNWWKKKIKESKIFRVAISAQTTDLSNKRGYGWTLTPNDFSFYEKFSSRTFGHTGYTGTSIMYDLVNEIEVIFLTNRVYYHTDQSFIDLRKTLHNIIADYLKI